MHNHRYHNRRSIRLQEYDYSSTGLYFITINTQGRQCLFGEVKNGEMVQSEAGRIAHKIWHSIPERFDRISLDQFVVMPNHVHGIIIIKPDPDKNEQSTSPNKIMTPHTHETDSEAYRKQRRLMLLSKVIGWYKMNVAKQVNILIGNTGNRLWQRNYYEHIIRDEQARSRIRAYIKNNPVKWDEEANGGDDTKAPGK